MKKQKKSFWKSPAALVLLVVAMIAMILAIVVFSAKKEAEIAETKKNEAEASRPQVTVAPTSPPSEEEVIIDEDGDGAIKITASGTYHNNIVRSVSTGYGMTLSVGIELPEANDAIYLNPHFTYEYAGNPDEAYCYLLKSERVPLEYSNNSPGSAYNSASQNTTDFAIRGRTYDKVVPVSCVDSSNYGVRWKDNPGLGGKANDGDVIHILAIRISDGTLMGAAKAEITYSSSSGSYQISTFDNADVSVTGELTAAQREQIIQDSFDYLINGNDQASFGVTMEDLEQQKPFIVVERPGRTYYNRLYDKGGSVIASGTLSNCNVYAVNINYNGFGFFTIYFAPEPQAHGLQIETMPTDEDLKLVIVGYDAFAPMTVDTFNSYLFPDDIDIFGADKY